jgi:hypothetical protein
MRVRGFQHKSIFFPKSEMQLLIDGALIGNQCFAMFPKESIFFTQLLVFTFHQKFKTANFEAFEQKFNIFCNYKPVVKHVSSTYPLLSP